jgi:hypothetical protein
MKHARKDYQGRIVDLKDEIPAEEPVFLVRAQDKFGARLLRTYAQMHEDHPEGNREMAMIVRHHADQMDRWPKKKVADLPAPSTGK